MTISKFIRTILEDTNGSTLIETAFIVPAMVTMCLGGVEISQIVVRQHELQTVAADGLEIIMAASPEGAEEVASVVADVQDYLVAESGLTKVDKIDGPGEIRVYRMWRCGSSTTMQKSSGCENNVKSSAFLVVHMTDSYDPIWHQYGIGDTLMFNVKRSIQIG